MHKWLGRTLVPIAVCGLIFAGAAPAGAGGGGDHRGHHQQFLSARLTGAAEAPGPGDPDGRGSFFAVAKRDKLCYVLTARKIEPAAAAHIHVAPPGSPGPIVVGLVAPTDGFSAGCIMAVAEEGADPTMTLTNNELAAIKADPPAYYVNVHNASFMAGAIRGQLR